MPLSFQAIRIVIGSFFSAAPVCPAYRNGIKYIIFGWMLKSPEESAASCFLPRTRPSVVQGVDGVDDNDG